MGQLPVAKGVGRFDFDIPEPDDAWHPLARQLWDGLVDSGMSDYYQFADWAAAHIMCETLSRELLPQFVGFQDRFDRGLGIMEHLPTKMKLPIKGGNLTAILRMFAILGVTEGDRRRLNIELQRGPAEENPDDAAMATVTDIETRMTGGAS